MPVACGRLFEPDLSHAAGSYDLELMDGKPLPVKVNTGDCPLEVYRGLLTLTPPSVEQTTAVYGSSTYAVQL